MGSGAHGLGDAAAKTRTATTSEATAARLRVGVMGTGSIGGFVGGVLASRKDVHVTFVARADTARRLASKGVCVKDQRRPFQPASPSVFAVSDRPEALAECELVLVCVKSSDTPVVGSLLAPIVAPDCVVVSLQNGVDNAETLQQALPQSVASVPGIVSFNVITTSAPDVGTVYHRTMDGPIMLGGADPRVARLCDALNASGVACKTFKDLKPHQWTKLLVNLNNAVSALSGAPTVAMLASPGYRRVIAALVDEALDVLRGADIKPARLRGVPIGWMPTILRLPTWLVRRIIGAQMKIDPEARSSMWEDLERRRDTEVDYLNGAVVRLAEASGQNAPLNARIVAAVKEAAAAKRGSPGHSAEVLSDMLGLRTG